MRRAGGGAGRIEAGESGTGVFGTGMFGTARLDNDRLGADRFGMAPVGGNDGSSRTGGTGVVISTSAGRDMGVECMDGRAIGIDGCAGLACRPLSAARAGRESRARGGPDG